MTQMTARDLDLMLRNLIANPDRLEETKAKLQGGVSIIRKATRWADRAPDDVEDLFDNLPV